ncbi:MAG: PAS domain-containing protein, partial [Alphaproteobacteria bacterium]|nr:PAS domain-containing protein [Alphaproteobacteria bacterium]
GFALIRGGNQALAVSVGLAVTGVAAIDLALTLTDAGRESGAQATIWSALPAATALSVALAGLNLVFSGFGRYDLAATALAGLAGAIAVLTLLGYLTGINTLYEVALIRSPPLPMAVGLLCVAVGLIMRIDATPALRRPRPLWQLLAVLGGAIVVPLLLFGAYAGTRLADAQFNQVREELMDEARTLSSDVDREIIGEIETLEALAASPSLQRGDFAAFQRQAEAPLTLRQSGNIMLVDRNLQQIVNTSAPFGTPMPRAVIAETVERVFLTGKTQVTSLFEGPVAHEVLFAIVIPVKVGGEFRYVLVRSPSQHALARVVGANRLPAGRTAVVFDGAHRIIAQSGTRAPKEVVGSELPPPQWPRGGPRGIVEFSDSQGQPSLQAFTLSDLTGWGTAVSAPKAVLGAPLRTLWRTLGWMALLASGLVVALALWVGRIIARSVGHAARAAAAVGEGRPLPASGTPVAEVNTLMATLEETAAKREAAEGCLRDSEGRLQLALTAAQLGTWHYDPGRDVVSGGVRGRALLDIAGDEATAAEVLARVHPEDQEKVSEALAESLDPAGPERSAMEFRLRCSDGALRWLESLWLTRFEGAGRERRPAGIVGTIADITARKELEEERRAQAEKEHLLMREMNHRAKNMLSVVDAIAHQTATRNPEDFIKCFSARIQSLSANQDLLFRSEWKGVEISGLVHAQLAHFADLISSRIFAEGPRLRVNAASAQAIGLALHELATNAGKYGALSTQTGRVDIRWDAAGGAFTMSWIESGGPTVSPPQRRGFGSVVMGVMVERSVGGTVVLEHPPTGVTWRLTCPTANVLEAGSGGQHAGTAAQSAQSPPPPAGESREAGTTELTMR